MKWLCCLLLILSLTGASPARADQNDPALGGLFAALKTEERPQTITQIETAIWGIWHEVSDPVVDSLLRRGIIAMNRGDLTRALQAFDEVVALAPDFAEGWNRRATARYLVHDYEGSLADIEETLALEPRHFGALSGRGLCLTETGDFEGAIEAFEEALAIHPHLSGAQINLEFLREEIGASDI